MKGIESHYRIIVVVNELKEFSSSFRTKSKTSQISIAVLLNDSYNLNREDVFIGSEANWTQIKERIEDFRHLSYLKSGKLELVYCGDFGEQTKQFRSDTSYFHFFDECVKKEDLLLELKSLGAAFETELIIASVNDLTAKSSISKVLRVIDIENFLDLKMA